MRESTLFDPLGVVPIERPKLTVKGVALGRPLVALERIILHEFNLGFV